MRSQSESCLPANTNLTSSGSSNVEKELKSSIENDEIHTKSFFQLPPRSIARNGRRRGLSSGQIHHDSHLRLAAQLAAATELDGMCIYHKE